MPRHLSPPRSIGISRFGSSRPLMHKVTDPAKLRIPTLSDLPPRVPSWIDDSDHFGESHLAISRSVELSPRQAPKCRTPEVRWTLILHACGRGYLLRNSSSIGRSSELRRTSRGSPTIYSLSPEEISSAPPSFYVASTGVDFRSKQKNYLS